MHETVLMFFFTERRQSAFQRPVRQKRHLSKGRLSSGGLKFGAGGGKGFGNEDCSLGRPPRAHPASSATPRGLKEGRKARAPERILPGAKSKGNGKGGGRGELEGAIARNWE